jgi:hypothetical protein
MTEEEQRRYESCIAAVDDGNGNTRFMSITELRRDQLLKAYWLLQKKCEDLREEIKKAGYPT